ncbi:MAG: ribonuclease H-like domain-containing protein [bacterium]|nr:ribonuclease H-like domain-containing protein [bacterium]
MLTNIDLKNVLIIDIETVPQYATFEELSDNWKALWSKKMQYHIKDGQTASGLYDRAGIYSEFGKIVCISAGCLVPVNGGYNFRLKSFYGDDEKVILTDLTEMLDKHYISEEHSVCAHNGKEFDYPFIARRCLINGIPIPDILNNSGKKPWEVRLLDTMEIWKFGDYKSYTSLNLLAAVFGISTPKDDIDGSQVWSTYWIEKDVERIKKYCQKDIVTVAQLLLRFKGLDLLKEEDLIYTN